MVGQGVLQFTFVKVKITGLEKLNPRQSYVIVCNHQSIYDIFVVYGWLPMIFKWMMKEEVRRIPFVGIACEAAGHIFINRSNPVAAKHSLEKAESQLKNGVSVVIFPRERALTMEKWVSSNAELFVLLPIYRCR